MVSEIDIWKSTILIGTIVDLMAALLSPRILAELVNIGALRAFTIVSTAVLIMRRSDPDGIASCLLLMFSLPVATGCGSHLAVHRYRGLLCLRPVP
jgi:hypothetical protein